MFQQTNDNLKIVFKEFVIKHGAAYEMLIRKKLDKELIDTLWEEFKKTLLTEGVRFSNRMPVKCPYSQSKLLEVISDKPHGERPLIEF